MFNIDDILKEYRSRKESGSIKHNTVVEHTRIEDLIYKDKKNILDDNYKGIDYTIEEVQEQGKQKLESFPHLTQDVFNMLYKINPTERENTDLTDSALNFNKKIIEKIKENPEYGSLRLLTQGKDLESIEGAREFSKYIYDNLDGLLEDIAENKEVLNQISKANEVLDKRVEEYLTVQGMISDMKGNGKSENEIAPLRNKMESLKKNIEGVNKKKQGFEEIVRVSSFKNKDEISNKIDEALKHTIDKVTEVSNVLECFGTEDGRPKEIQGKTELIKKVNGSHKFREMAILIGKMRKLAKSQLNKSFTHGRGEKVGVEYGNNLSKVLSSEFCLLATEETKALFYKKYVQKELKQYKENRIEYKGRGHVIYLVDESGSTQGGREYWAKALGIALMDLAVKDHRNFAFIPYNTKVGNIQHVNSENYSEDTVLNIANTFLGGGTNFTEPIKIATQLLDDDRYDNADVVFVTDGEASIDNEILEKFNKIKEIKQCKCVGILLDKGGNGGVTDRTIKQFCDTIYKTSEISEDSIAQNVLNKVM